VLPRLSEKRIRQASQEATDHVPEWDPKSSNNFRKLNVLSRGMRVRVYASGPYGADQSSGTMLTKRWEKRGAAHEEELSPEVKVLLWDLVLQNRVHGESVSSLGEAKAPSVEEGALSRERQGRKKKPGERRGKIQHRAGELIAIRKNQGHSLSNASKEPRRIKRQSSQCEGGK